MSNQNTLFLIPTNIGTIPESGFFQAQQAEIVFSLTTFIVENAKTARHFLKAVSYPHELRQVEMLEFDEHNRNEFRQDIQELLKSGKNIGLMSEAGLPCVADPGHEVVAMAHTLNIKVKPLFGPSSIMMALMSSGFSGQRFVFHGYLPAKTNERLSTLKKISSEKDYTQIFMETPYRAMSLFEDIMKSFSPNSMLSIAAEINTENEFIKTMQISQWKQNVPDLNKKRCIFSIGN